MLVVNTKRFVIWVLIGVVIAVVGYVIYVWNKSPETVDKKDSIKISAVALANAFNSDEKVANDLYLGKVLEVEGKVAELNTNQDGKKVVLLEGEDLLSGVQCTMREKGGADFEIGRIVKLKGFCNGYTIVVLLSECVRVE